MSSVETTIQSIQDEMKKISAGIEQLKQTSFIDIVKEEQLKNFRLDSKVANEMDRRDIKEYYEGKLDKYDEKIKNIRE